MPFNIESFKARGLVLGGARPSLFEVFITAPFADPFFNEKQRFLVKASSIPPSMIDSIDVGYFGRKVKYVGDRIFPNWAVTVMNDEDYAIRKAFERWHSRMNSIVPNLQDAPGTGYKMDAIIRQYGKAGNLLAQYKMVGLFPTNINQMPLDWDAINQIQQFDVEFAYDYWIPADTNSGELGIEADFQIPQAVFNVDVDVAL